MLCKQPRHRQPTGRITPPASDFDHLDTASGNLTRQDHVARHVSMFALVGLARNRPTRSGEQSAPANPVTDAVSIQPSGRDAAK
jgi:hypothetical protein